MPKSTRYGFWSGLAPNIKNKLIQRVAAVIVSESFVELLVDFFPFFPSCSFLFNYDAPKTGLRTGLGYWVNFLPFMDSFL